LYLAFPGRGGRTPPDHSNHTTAAAKRMRSARWVIDERGGASKAVTTTVTISLAHSLTIEREKTVMIRD